MFKGIKTPLIIAVVLGAMAAGLIVYDRAARNAEQMEKWKPVKVLVAAVDLDPGVELTTESLGEDDMPSKFVYESIVVPRDMEYVVDRQVIVPIKRGEPIHWYQLRGLRGEERLAKAVQRQQRAVTIDVSERTAVGFWIQPNDRVDVLGTFRDPRTNQMVTITLLQQLTVLATGQTTAMTRGPGRVGNYSTITLTVAPDEAEMLTLAQDLGTLSLVLRNDKDLDVFEEDNPTTIETILSIEQRKKVRRRTRHQPKVTIERGIGAKRSP